MGNTGYTIWILQGLSGRKARKCEYHSIIIQSQFNHISIHDSSVTIKFHTGNTNHRQCFLILNQSYTHILQCSFKYLINSWERQCPPCDKATFHSRFKTPPCVGFVPWINVRILQCLQVQMNLCRVETNLQLNLTMWKQRCKWTNRRVEGYLQINGQLCVQSEGAPWELSCRMEISPSSPKSRAAAHRSCRCVMSTWSCFATRVLCWLFMRTTNLSAGVDPNTGQMHWINNHVCGQRVPNDARLTISSRPVSAVHSIPPLQDSNHCWSQISGSPPRPPPCRFSRTLIVSLFLWQSCKVNLEARRHNVCIIRLTKAWPFGQSVVFCNKSFTQFISHECQCNAASTQDICKVPLTIHLDVTMPMTYADVCAWILCPTFAAHLFKSLKLKLPLSLN